MDDFQYLVMLNEGLNKHRFYLPQYLLREQKKAQQDFVSKDEFVSRIWDIITMLEFITKRQVPESVSPELKRFSESLTLVETDQLIIDCGLLKESVIEAFEYETVGESLIFDLQELENQEKEAKKQKEALYNNKDLETRWFKVGLLFASGEIWELLSQFDNNFSKVAKYKFGDQWQSFRPYISESFIRRHISDKNIFSSNLKFNKLVQFCEHNDIHISSKFKQ